MSQSFMQRQITRKDKWLRVETTQGTEFLPSELVSNVSNCDADNVENMPLWFNAIQQYTEGEPQEWEWIEGYGARLSAPGYLDCTEWAVFDTVAEAEAYLADMYGDDDEDDDDSEGAS